MANCDSGTFLTCVGEILSHAYDTTANVDGLGVALASAVWTIDSGAAVTIGTQSIAGNESRVIVTAVSAGTSVLKCLATYSDGQVTRCNMTIKVK